MASSRTREASRPAAWRITIRRAWCKGCEFCIETCPRGVLAMDGPVACVQEPDRCTGCERCVWICPDFAIRIEKTAEADRPDP